MMELLRKLAAEMNGEDSEKKNEEESSDQDRPEEETEEEEFEEEEEPEEEEEEEGDEGGSEKEASLIEKLASYLGLDTFDLQEKLAAVMNPNGDSPDDQTAGEGKEEKEPASEDSEEPEEEEGEEPEEEEGEEPEDEAGPGVDSSLLSAVIDFFEQNPEPTEEDFQAFAEGSGVDPLAMKELAYVLAGRMASFFRSGSFIESGIGLDEIDPDELDAGIQAELRHVNDPALAKKLALDNLANIPDYYSRLYAMEQEAGASAQQEVAQEPAAEQPQEEPAEEPAAEPEPEKKPKEEEPAQRAVRE